MVYVWRWYLFLTIRAFLKNLFLEQLVGRGGPIAWSPSSPWDLYLQRYLKFTLMLQKSVTPQICNCGYNVVLSWFFRHIEFYSETDSQYLDVWRPMLQLKAFTLSVFFKLSRSQFTNCAPKDLFIVTFFLRYIIHLTPVVFAMFVPRLCSMQLYVQKLWHKLNLHGINPLNTELNPICQ